MLIIALLFFFIIGAACPVILWLITRRYPHTLLNYLKYVRAFSTAHLIIDFVFPASREQYPRIGTGSYSNYAVPWHSLVFSGLGQIPPATAVNYVPWAIIGFIFQFIIRRKHFAYWAKYNCAHPDSSPINERSVLITPSRRCFVRCSRCWDCHRHSPCVFLVSFPHVTDPYLVPLITCGSSLVVYSIP